MSRCPVCNRRNVPPDDICSCCPNCNNPACECDCCPDCGAPPDRECPCAAEDEADIAAERSADRAADSRAVADDANAVLRGRW